MSLYDVLAAGVVAEFPPSAERDLLLLRLRLLCPQPFDGPGGAELAAKLLVEVASLDAMDDLLSDKQRADREALRSLLTTVGAIQESK